MKGYTQTFDPVKYFRRFDGHGNGLIIKGRVRVGKTYLASILTRLLLLSGFAVISNVRFHDSVYEKYAGQLFYIRNDIEFFRAYIDIPDGQPIVLVWDDAQASEGMKSTGVMTDQGKKLASFLIFIGKFECNYIFVAHQKYIPSCIVEGFDPLIIYKFNRESFIVSDRLYDWDNDVYTDPNAVHVPVPKPDLNQHLAIQSRALTGFKFELDLADLWDYLGRYEVGENLKQATTEYLDTRLDADDGAFDRLKSLSYKEIFMALSMKRDRIISDGDKVGDLISPADRSKARKLLRSLGYK